MSLLRFLWIQIFFRALSYFLRELPAPAPTQDNLCIFFSFVFFFSFSLFCVHGTRLTTLQFASSLIAVQFGSWYLFCVFNLYNVFRVLHILFSYFQFSASYVHLCVTWPALPILLCIFFLMQFLPFLCSLADPGQLWGMNPSVYKDGDVIVGKSSPPSYVSPIQ